MVDDLKAANVPGDVEKKESAMVVQGSIFVRQRRLKKSPSPRGIDRALSGQRAFTSAESKAPCSSRGESPAPNRRAFTFFVGRLFRVLPHLRSILSLR
ncbi:unnamed protein product [Linum trigynum]|uniref:Uncharacterized protein n=1 Tax=Linum trigynum TaxID=586398 RepID=A0AAV2E1I9_9ROSI